GEWGTVDADGIIVDARGWQGAPALAVQTADCLPVVFSAASGQIVAAVHAGRRGLLGGILDKTVDRIRSLDGGPIDALIGPAICGRCYEVPADMADESEELMPGIRSVTSWDTPALDLPRAAASTLGARGVRVEIDERCTLEDADLFSYRADSSCGRQALIIVPA
ncbi:MAG: polyphenol oxidase family protein, partial [Schaalia sp.]